MSVPHWVMGYWSKLVAELRTEPVSFSQAMENFGYSNHAHQSLYWSTGHDGGLGSYGMWERAAAANCSTLPHFSRGHHKP